MDFWKVLEEGLWNVHREKKEGLQQINEHFIHSKEYGFIVLASH